MLLNRMSGWVVLALALTISGCDQLGWTKKPVESSEPTVNFESALGEFVATNKVKAFQDFEQLANQGDPASQYFLGALYQKGEGTLKSDQLQASQLWEKAIPELEKQAANKDPKALYTMGNAYATGRGVGVDGLKAVELLDQSIENGYEPAKLLKAQIYARGVGVDKTPEKAQEIFLELVKAGNPLAMMDLAMLFEEQGNDSEALYYLTMAAKTGLPNAQCALGARFEEGALKQYPDPERANIWYTKAAESGFSLCQDYLGENYAQGQYVKKDWLKAAYWHLSAAKQNEAEAQYHLALDYMQSGILGKGDKERVAYAWMHRAQLNGAEDAKNQLIIFEKKVTAQQKTDAIQLSEQWKIGSLMDPAEMKILDLSIQ